MTDKELKKLSRSELLELLLAQQKEIERLEGEVKEWKEKYDERLIEIARSGSIAQAAFAISDIFDEAQRVADSYVKSVKYQADKGQLIK